MMGILPWRWKNSATAVCCSGGSVLVMRFFSAQQVLVQTMDSFVRSMGGRNDYCVVVVLLQGCGRGGGWTKLRYYKGKWRGGQTTWESRRGYRLCTL